MKYANIENIQVAGSIIPFVSVNTMPNWQSEVINNKSGYIPQIFIKDSYWIAVQDLISAVADEKEIQILSGNIKCEYTEKNTGILMLYLKGCWTLEQIECINEALSFIPHKDSMDVSFDAFEGDITVYVRFD